MGIRTTGRDHRQPTSVAQTSEPYPLQRELVDWSLPQSTGLFQFGVRSPVRDIEVLPLRIAMTVGEDPGSSAPGPRARAYAGVLADMEFRALGRFCAGFMELGCPEDYAVPFNPGSLTRAITGQDKPGSVKRGRLMSAIDNLVTTKVVIPGFNPTTQEVGVESEFHGTLLQGVVAQRCYGEYMRARERGNEREAARLAGSLRGESTWVAILPSWMGDRIRRLGGVVLDAKAQRSLRGNQRNVALGLEGLPYVRDGDQSAETALVSLTEAVYDSLGLRHTEMGQRRRALQRALDRIVEVDATYKTLSIRTHPASGRLNQLVAVRYFGAARQRRLRQRAAVEASIELRATDAAQLDYGQTTAPNADPGAS